jgi:hypothetical protein
MLSLRVSVRVNCSAAAPGLFRTGGLQESCCDPGLWCIVVGSGTGPTRPAISAGALPGSDCAGVLFSNVFAWLAGLPSLRLNKTVRWSSLNYADDRARFDIGKNGLICE